MRVLLVKTSSMGDIIHTFPAVTDALAAQPALEIDWVVEEGFADIARLHPGIARVIPVAVRRWRKAPFSRSTHREIAALWSTLRGSGYDLVLDAQGLVKSAVLARLAGSPIEGLDRASLREPLAFLFYAQGHRVPRDLHAIERVRRLFGAVLGYRPDLSHLDYGLGGDVEPPSKAVMLLHGTSWPSKRWSVDCWGALARAIASAGLQPTVTWGGADEKVVAEAIAAIEPRTVVLPKGRLADTALAIRRAMAVVGTDTGLTHLAVAYDRPTVAIFLSTAPDLTGPRGNRVDILAATVECAPCRKRDCPLIEAGATPPCVPSVSPDRVSRALHRALTDANGS